jgi:hypothetical protein
MSSRLVSFYPLLVLGLLILFPVSHHAFKLPLVILGSVLALSTPIVRASARDYPRYWFFFFYYLLITGTWSFASLALENRGALHQFAVYCVLPALVALAMSPLLRKNSIEDCQRYIAHATAVLIALHLLLYLSADFVLLRPLLQFALGDESELVTYEGYAQMRSIALSSFVFIAPYYVSKAMLDYAFGKLTLSTMLLAVLAIVVVGFGGRRAIVISTATAGACALLLSLYWMAKTNATQQGLKARPNRIVPLLMVGIAQVLAFIIFSDVATFVVSAFSPSEDMGAYERVGQTEVLLNSFLQSPLVGHGVGAVAEGWVRSLDAPWQYEMQYALYLFQFGSLGTLMLSLGFAVYVFVGLRGVLSSPNSCLTLGPCILGLLSLLICNATNPYMQAYGHLWMVFLPIIWIEVAQRYGVGGAAFSTPPALLRAPFSR